MKTNSITTLFIFSILLFLLFFSGTIQGYSLNSLTVESSENESKFVELHLNASTYNFTPNKLVANLGDNVTIFLHALDRIHGFYLEGYDISQTMCNEHDFSISFIANKVGTFLFRCDEPACGPYHPYMIGSFTINPNNSFNFQLFIILSSFLTINVIFYHKRRKNSVIKSKRIEP